MSKKFTSENELRKRLLMNTPNLEDEGEEDVDDDEDSPTATLLKTVPSIPSQIVAFENLEIPPLSMTNKSIDKMSSQSKINSPPGLGTDYHYEKTVVFGRYHSEEMPFGIRKDALTQVPGLSAKSIQWANKNEFGKDKSSSITNILEACDDNNFKRNSRRRKSATISAPKVVSNFTKFKRNLIRFLFDDWMYLAILGFVMAICSFVMDTLIELLQKGHINLLNAVENTAGITQIQALFCTYFVWVGYCIVITTTCAIIVHYLGPQAIGSGIPEMKTILRGVYLKEYLSKRTLLSKMIGLTLSLGSGLPIGKEGPFVHVASVLASILSKCVHNKNSVYSNESRRTEMLAAGCAVGVACTFSAPVGGVLFSIEVTSVYFAVRNYWRGFFAAACSATLFRILRVVLSDTQLTVVAFFQTSFPRDAFVPIEMLIFAIIGVIAGLFAALFIVLQRKLVRMVRHLNTYSKGFLAKHYWIYPIIISFLISTITFPKGYGQFIAGEKKFSVGLREFFSNCTYIADHNATNYCGFEFMQSWQGKNLQHNVFLVLIAYQVSYFFLSALASTIPIPSGIFMPVFVIGASFGRFVGELMALWFPLGIDGSGDILIYPGVYAVVGAAAFCGGVTHTVSVAVIVFELTGQLMYILPVMIAVLISNAICAYLQPSIYDSIIEAKNLPYLPDIPSTSSYFHGIMVQQFMIKKVAYLTQLCNFRDIQDILINYPKLKSFPIVDGKESLILLGSCNRQTLFDALENHVGAKARRIEANSRIQQEKFEAARRMKSTKELAQDVRCSIMDISFDPTLPYKRKLRTISTISGTQKRLFKKQKEFEKYGTIGKSNSASDYAIDDLPLDTKPQSKTPETLNCSKSRFTVTPVTTSDSNKDVDFLQVSNSPTKVTSGSESKLYVGYGKKMSVKSAPEFSIDKEHTDDEDTDKSKNDANIEGSITPRAFGSADQLSVSHLSIDHSNSSESRKNSLNIFTFNSARDAYNTISGALRSIQRKGIEVLRNQDYDDKEYDLFGDERKEWEDQQLSQEIDMNNIGIDPAPFQLVEATSLFKVHSLFNLLGLNRAYVTKCGRLVGVVALRDIRYAIERIQQGTLFPSSPGIYVDTASHNGDVNYNIKENKEENIQSAVLPEILVTDHPEEKPQLVRRKTTLVRTNSDPCLHDIVKKLSVSSKPNLIRLNSTPLDKSDDPDSKIKELTLSRKNRSQSSYNTTYKNITESKKDIAIKIEPSDDEDGTLSDDETNNARF
uniref:Chloride channel protein n=1 Tax=Parastrongyloides trichosuri TaxID=131310 RepID=A0A0N4Z7Z2_PARTI